MKTLILLLGSFLATNVFALTVKDLRSGDVVLLSLNCIECRVIESETNSLFSHSGVIVFDQDQRVRVAQSLGNVALYSFADFTGNITPGTFVHVYRAREFKKLSQFKKTMLEKTMLDVFNEKYRGAPFDSKYIWNNFNSKGEELLYCSEFIAKFLDNFLTQKTVTTIITYDKHYDYWIKYFKGLVPENELGNSPASFSRDNRFEFIGTI
jgi:hypothetical protein